MLSSRPRNGACRHRFFPEEPMTARNVAVLLAVACAANAQLITIDSPMPPPGWAFAQRALLKESTAAAVEFAARYIDSRGHFRGVERWGGNDGPDDVMETFHNWPLAHALGASGN